MFFSAYKKKQGMIIRWGSFATTAAIILFGVHRFYYDGPYGTTTIEKTPEIWRWLHFQTVWTKIVIPAVDIEIPLSPRLAITVGMGLFFLLLSLYFHFKHQRASSFLIDTESEMRKVAWPTKQEVFASSIVVVIVIFILSIYLYVVDAGLAYLAKWVFF